MHNEDRLAAIGPYTVVRDEDGSLLVRWPGLPPPFGLESDALSFGLTGRRYPHGRMFELRERWKAKYEDFAAEIAVAVEPGQEAAGFPARADAWVVVSQIEDGPNCCYSTVGARVTVGTRQIVCEPDQRGRLRFR